MDVEVDVYSGRPNPRFRLDPATITELLRRLAALPPAQPDASVREGLGYRGLRIDADPSHAPIAAILISGGTVVVRERTGRTRRLRDPDRALERWLVETAATILDPDTAELLRRDLSHD